MKYETKILHNGNEIDHETGALSIPIYNTSTFHQADYETRQKFDYSRSGNPTRAALENVLAALENCQHGFAFASGMAAISASVMALFRPGDHLVVTKDIYGGAYRFFTQFAVEFGIEITFADFTNLAEVAGAITPNTKALYIESPTNPLMKIVDIEAVAVLAKKHSLLSLIDNTFMSPYLMRPLDLGIDVSIHSATKFLGGHSDLIAGAVMVKDALLAKKIYFVQNTCGAVLGPNDSWLLMRGIKTLAARMKQQEANAQKIAEWLTKQSFAAAVYYPGLKEHPGHEILARQADGFGAVLSFRAQDNDTAKKILMNVKIWATAVSLGGIDSIISYPCKMSHAAIPEPVRNELGITPDLIRLSVGLEDAGDLIEDIARAV
jgi:cysteine-S-conjugate beta-lyase